MWATLKSLSGACRLETTGGIAAHDIAQHSYAPWPALWRFGLRCWRLAAAGRLLGRSTCRSWLSIPDFRGVGFPQRHAHSDTDPQRRLQTRRRVGTRPKCPGSSAAGGGEDRDEGRGRSFCQVLVQLLSYAYETGDVALFESIEPPSCAACQKVKEVIRDWHSEGRWLVGGKLTTPVAETTFVKDEDGKYDVAVQVRQEPLSYMRPDGSAARTDPQKPDQGNLLILTCNNNEWSVVELGSIVG
jgi:hypothetical protein